MNENCSIGKHEFLILDEIGEVCFHCGMPKPEKPDPSRMNELLQKYNSLKQQLENIKNMKDA